MSLNDPLSNALSKILNAEKVGNKECILKPTSKIIQKVLDVLKDNQYLGEYTFVEDGKGGLIKLNLLGKINKCGAIKPRHAVQSDNFEKFEKRFLPAKGFGILIMTTSNGIMIHEQAKEKGIGGKLIAYCY